VCPHDRRWRFFPSVLGLMKMGFRLPHTVWVLYFLFPVIHPTSHLNKFTRSKALARRSRPYTCRNRHLRLLRLASARYIIRPNRRIILCIYVSAVYVQNTVSYIIVIIIIFLRILYLYFCSPIIDPKSLYSVGSILYVTWAHPFFFPRIDFKWLFSFYHRYIL